VIFLQELVRVSCTFSIVVATPGGDGSSKLRQAHQPYSIARLALRASAPSVARLLDKMGILVLRARSPRNETFVRGIFMV